ncbi:MAG: hypothetical protein FJZ16_01910 [Candidatus Omnitrophica bacterium]|nr:hypothetical protein [Candidatus Omnitrophota bacterium]
MIVTLDKIINELKGLGSAGEEIAIRNQIDLLLIRDLKWESLSVRLRERHLGFNKYISTIVYIASILNSLDIQFIFIKLFRNYPFLDSNIDILIPHEKWGCVFELLKRDGWTLPNLFGVLKQNLIEKGKIKLYSKRKKYLPLHFYETGSWRGFEYLPLKVIYNNSISLKDYGVEIKIPNKEMEFLISTAHAVFENYELTLGELYYLNEIKNTTIISNNIAQKQRWIKALRLVLDIVEEFSQMDVEQILKTRWPLLLPIEKLRKCWIERCNTQSNKDNIASGYIEFITHLFWCWVIRSYRKHKYKW